MAQQPAGFVPDGFEPDGFEAEASPQMNFATVNGQRVPVEDSPRAGASEFLQNVNPIPGAIALGKAGMAGAKVFGAFGSGDVSQAREGLGELGDIGKDVLAAQNHVKEGADAAWAAGDYKTAVRKYADWLIPLLGPQMDVQADNLAKGDYWKAAGGLAGLGTMLAGPELLKNVPIRIPSVKVLPSVVKRTTNPVEASAVALGEREGVPLDLGTVTGSPAVRNMQKRMEGTIGGAAPTQAFQAEKDLGLTRTGEKFANQVHPTQETPLSAGGALHGEIESHVKALDSTADAAYTQLRALEQANPTAIDVAGAQSGLQALYQQLLQENALVPLQGGRGKMLVALDRFMKGPNTVPLSVAERSLSDLKALSRGNEAMPELRTGAQGIASKAVGELQAQVDAAATRAGQPVIDALKRGRAATREKYAVADVLDALNAKDVSAYNQVLTKPAIQQLRELKRIAPNSIPKIARAWLDEKLELATQEGGFGHTDKLYADWQKMGAETKAELFGARMTKDLDDFFKLAKDLGKNPNPSGTANVLGFNTAQALAYLPTKALAKMLYNPTAIKLLTQGMRVGGRPGVLLIKNAAKVARVPEVIRAAGEQSRTVPVAQDDTDTTRRAPQPSR